MDRYGEEKKPVVGSATPPTSTSPLSSGMRQRWRRRSGDTA